MGTAIEPYMNKVVSIITADGRNFIGTLKGFDQTLNIILEESFERIYSSSQGVEQIPLGLQIIRGDNIAVIGELDEEIDQRLDYSQIKADPLNPIVH